MKFRKLLNISALLTLLFISGCDDNVDFNISDPESVFVLNEPSVSNVFLNFNYLDNPALTVTWDDDVTGASTYEVEMSLDIDFTKSVKLGTTSEKQYTVSVADFNQALTGLGASAYSNTTVLIRVFGNGSYSNKVAFNVNTYPEENPNITAPDGGTSVTLSMDTPDDTALTVSWEDPSISDASTVSVDYSVEIDLAGNDFANSKLLGKTQAMSLDATHDVLNQAALSIGIEPEVATDVDVRVKAVIETTSGTITRYSDPLTIALTAYANYPDLFLVGDGSAAGWSTNNDNHPMFRDQDQAGLYHYIGYFKAGSVKLIETLGQWAPMYGTNDGLTLVYRPTESDPDPGVISIPADGYYYLKVDIVSLTFSVTPYDASAAPIYPTLGLIGDATPDKWDSDTDFTQDSNNPHLWFIKGITLTSGGSMLIRANNVWPPSSDAAIWRYTGSEELYGTLRLDNGGGDNIPFNAPTGSYDVWFNDLDGRYIIMPK